MEQHVLNPKIVFFDIDGTLWDYKGNIKCLRFNMSYYSLKGLFDIVLIVLILGSASCSLPPGQKGNWRSGDPALYYLCRTVGFQGMEVQTPSGYGLRS